MTTNTLTCKGDFFTWSNNQSANHIYSRVDRLIANVEWFQDNNDLTLNVLPPNVCDHAMLMLCRPMFIKKVFRFNKCLTELNGYDDIVQSSWERLVRGRPMEVMCKKLERLKPKLR